MWSASCSQLAPTVVHTFRKLPRLCTWVSLFLVNARAQLTCNCQRTALCSHYTCVLSLTATTVQVQLPLSLPFHVALLDPGCPLRINCSCITRAPRTGPLIAQHSGGWHSHNSAHQNQGGALLHHISLGVDINDNCTEMVVKQDG